MCTWIGYPRQASFGEHMGNSRDLPLLLVSCTRARNSCPPQARRRIQSLDDYIRGERRVGTRRVMVCGQGRYRRAWCCGRSLVLR